MTSILRCCLGDRLLSHLIYHPIGVQSTIHFNFSSLFTADASCGIPRQKQDTRILRRLHRLRPPAHFLLAAPKLRRCAPRHLAMAKCLWSNHGFVAGSVLQKEMPSEWMAFFFVSCEHYGSTAKNKIVTQRSGHDFERRKTFAVEAGALAWLPDIQRSFLRVFSLH